MVWSSIVGSSGMTSGKRCWRTSGSCRTDASSRNAPKPKGREAAATMTVERFPFTASFKKEKDHDGQNTKAIRADFNIDLVC
jgi:hypothetical protein